MFESNLEDKEICTTWYHYHDREGTETPSSCRESTPEINMQGSNGHFVALRQPIPGPHILFKTIKDSKAG
jgi:hypothetical protein